jgi:hypothetical protein
LVDFLVVAAETGVQRFILVCEGDTVISELIRLRARVDAYNTLLGFELGKVPRSLILRELLEEIGHCFIPFNHEHTQQFVEL